MTKPHAVAGAHSPARRAFGARIMLLAGIVLLPASGQPQKISCRVTGQPAALPGLSEASGLAASRRNSTQLWSHNDSGDPVLFALTTAGAIQGRTRVTGAQVGDWEAVSSGPCPQGNCIYIGDIGDNNGNRRDITIYRVAEPQAGAKETGAVQPLRATYPDGPQDAEAMFIMPNGALFIVTKGESGPVALYSVPAQFGNATRVQLERVATVVPTTGQQDKGKQNKGKQGNGKQDNGVPMTRKVTDASVSPNGQWIALRTRENITFYAASEFVAGKIREAFRFDLSAAREQQGEGVTFASDGAIWLASEGGGKSRPGSLARLDCALP